ncbi:MAG: hypothetical protein AAFR87_20190 [Bacteroidota bacterium]
MKNFFLFFIGGMLLSSCINYSDSYTLSPQRKRVDLLNPLPGQISRYEMFRACGSGFGLTGDTLILEVEEKEGVIYFKERFSQTSPIRSFEFGRAFKEYPVYSENKRLKFASREDSFLFWFYQSDYLDLAPAQPIPIEIQECSFDFPTQFYEKQQIGSVEQFRIGFYLLLDNLIAVGGPQERSSFLLYSQRELTMSFYLKISFSRGFRLIHPGMDRL